MTPPLMAESEEEGKSLLKGKEESEKAGLKFNIQKTKIMGISSHHFMANRRGNNKTSDRLYFLGLQTHCRWWLQPWNWKTTAPWKKSYDQPRQHIQKQSHYFPNKGPSSQGYGFSSSHVWMWELDHKEGWAPKNWCFWTVVLEKTVESPLDCRDIQPVHPRGDQSWIFIGRTDAEAKAPTLWPYDVKNWLLEKTLMLGRTEGRRRRGRQRMRLLDGITDSMKFEQAPESWWWTGKPGVPWSIGSERVRNDWVTELNWANTLGKLTKGNKWKVLRIDSSI